MAKIKTNNGTWVKLYRSSNQTFCANNPEAFSLWIHLLLLAQHSDSDFLFNGELVKLKVGQLLTGRKALSLKTGITENKIIRLLKIFENQQQIRQAKTKRYTIISITNWHKYQLDQQVNQQPTDNRPTTDQQPTDTYKNDNKEKNDNNEKIGGTLSSQSMADLPTEDLIELRHTDETIKTEIKVRFTKEQLEKLRSEFTKLEGRHWCNQRIEWLMKNPKEVNKPSRSDYLAIKNWRRRKLEDGFVWDEDVMPLEGYYKPWAIEARLQEAEANQKRNN